MAGELKPIRSRRLAYLLIGLFLVGSGFLEVVLTGPTIPNWLLVPVVVVYVLLLTFVLAAVIYTRRKATSVVQSA